MTMHQKAPFRGIASVRADAGDPAKLVAEIQKAFAEFKTANDQRLDALAKGKADVVLDEKVDRINAEISTMQAMLSEVSAKASAAALNGGGGGEADQVAKHAKAFAKLKGSAIDAEAYSAYRAGVEVYLRRGDSMPADVRAAMSVGSDPDGGYSVTPDMTGRIVERVRETSPMRQVANVVTIGTDRLEGFNDLDEAGSGWVGETQARAETSTPGLGKWEIPVHEVYANPKATQKLLDDSMFDIETWLSRKVADRFTRQENAAFVSGDGELKPRGLFTYPTAATADAGRAWGTFEHLNTTASGAFAADPDGGNVLIDTVFRLKAVYRANAAWMMSRATLAAVRKLRDGDDNYLWQPDFTARQGGTLIGYPVVEGEDVPALAANSLSISFGDHAEAYTIVDRAGIRVLRDPFTQKGFILFYTTKRVGGGALNFEAVKFVRFGS